MIENNHLDNGGDFIELSLMLSVLSVLTVPNEVRSSSFLPIDDIVDEDEFLGLWTSSFLDTVADLFSSLPHTSAAAEGFFFSSR